MQFTSAYLGWEQFLGDFQRARTPWQIEAGLLPDSVYDILEQTQDAEPRGRLVKRIQSRAKRKNFSTVFHVVLQIMLGLFHRFEAPRGNDDDDDEEENANEVDDLTLWLRALGLERLQQSGVFAGVDLGSDLERSLQELSALFADYHPTATLAAVESSAVQRDRDDLRSLLPNLQAICEMFVSILNKQTAALFVDARQALANMTPLDQASSMLLWLALRERFGDAALDHWVGVVRQGAQLEPFFRAHIEQSILQAKRRRRDGA